MSYILEALKKSQSDRELGQVPRVQGFGVDVPVEPPRSHPLAYVALLGALLAVAGGGYLLLRFSGMAPELETSAPVLSPAAPRPDRAVHGVAAQASDAWPSGADVVAASPAAPGPVQPNPAASPVSAPERSAAELSKSPAPAARGPAADLWLPAPPLEPAVPQAGPAVGGQPAPRPPPPRTAGLDARGSMPLSDPNSLSVEPEVLVVPAPAKPGEPLPRGAEELRRAVLGDGGRMSASVNGPNSLPSPPPPDQPLPGVAPLPTNAPVPDDVLAEIEAFKDLVRKENPNAGKRAATAPPRLPEPPGLERLAPPPQLARPPRPSLDLRNRLPEFSMTVHVYNPDPARRFVYINGRKVAERQESREGLRLEQVLTDGAVLSYQGERFFQRR